MTDAATKARENATSCEAKKHAYRQTQDGVVVSFVLHPQEVPAALTLAALGTRYMLALVEIGDDEQPKEVMPIAGALPAHVASPPDTRPAPDNPVASVPARAKRSWRDKSYGEQAAILGSEAGFRRFLLEQAGIVGRTGVCEAITEDKAAEMVKAHCLVSSRADIRDNHPSGRLWRELVERYRVWEAAPACGVA